MSNKDEALKMAIEALDTLMMEKDSIYQKAIQACKEALEQPAFDYNTAFSHGYEAHKAEREYPTKEEMLNKIFEATYQQHSAKLMQPNEGSITFNNPNADWVLRITPNRKIEVNEDVEVTEAAQKVLDAIQPLLDKQTAQDFFERGKEIAKWADKQNEQPAQEPVSLGDFDNMTKEECVDYIDYLRKEIDLLRFKEWQKLSDYVGYVARYT